MSSGKTQEYDDALVTLLEAVWGEGYLSPGGPEEIRRIVDGVDFVGAAALDIGCGAGGITRFLAETCGPETIVGVDIDRGLIERARKRAAASSASERIAFRTVEPGPLPFGDAVFDVIFSKDAMVHIADKEALFADIFRLLRPGGTLAASDWMSAAYPPFSAEMTYYLEQEGLGFGMAPPARYRSAMAEAGFRDIRMTDRNDWYRPLAHREHEALRGPLYERLAASVGKDFADHEIEVWRALTVVVDSGELRPVHLRARKPAD